MHMVSTGTQLGLCLSRKFQDGVDNSTDFTDILIEFKRVKDDFSDHCGLKSTDGPLKVGRFLSIIQGVLCNGFIVYGPEYFVNTCPQTT